VKCFTIIKKRHLASATERQLPEAWW